ncbi:hypothetical protein GCM10010124_02340 [Pilimelia terevasa]|uniref:Uncharacterized protein n=1 Tax=Pilimelia terevasa TaxID=53372 RepID=A0A8J3BEA0_9ACTN|nr:hypothetical protein [Pilimelia terevasa]GGK13286.1 hypothetical protein GCM10010124_02340 [Pilimelia terevasa]
MPAKKITNDQEVVRWYEQGRTFQWMVEEYRRKYNIEVSPTTFSEFVRRLELPPRSVRNHELIPWRVEPRHKWRHAIVMLRAEARRRAGENLAKSVETKLNSWLSLREADGLVVHYDPATEQGFSLVPRRPNIDTDLIRVPDAKTTVRTGRSVD